jgi:hypothetical protein
LLPKDFHRDIRQWDLRDSIRRLRVRNPYRPVVQIELVLFHRCQLFVDPKTGFEFSAVPSTSPSAAGTSHELSPGPRRLNMDSQTGTSFAPLHSACGGRLLVPDGLLLLSPIPLLHESIFCLHQHPCFESRTKVSFDIVRCQIGELGVLERGSQMLQRTLVDLMGLLRAEQGLGKILQIKIRSFPKCEILATAQCRQSIVVSGLQALCEASLRFAPIFRKRRFAPAGTVLIAISDQFQCRR